MASEQPVAAHASGQMLTSIPINPSTGAELPLAREGAVQVSNIYTYTHNRDILSLPIHRHEDPGRSGQAARWNCLGLPSIRGQWQPCHFHCPLLLSSSHQHLPALEHKCCPSLVLQCPKPRPGWEQVSTGSSWMSLDVPR